MSAAERIARFGPWALVTGASDGIGRAVARQLAQDGMNLVLVGRRAAALDALAVSLRAMAPIQVRVLALDLALPASPARLDAETADLDLGLAVLAAGYGSLGPFIDDDPESAEGMVEVNCRSVLATVRRFAPRFQRRGRGAFVLFGSLVGFQGVPLSANYAATKAYVQSLGEGLASELAPQGIAVLTVAPGPVLTGFADRAGMVMTDGDAVDEVARDIVAGIGRSGTRRVGRRGRFLGIALATLPRALRSTILAGVMRGMRPVR